jgi:hydroxyethylthiazole kinase-like sugar kinase family protein
MRGVNSKVGMQLARAVRRASCMFRRYSRRCSVAVAIDLIVGPDFIHGRFCDVGSPVFQSITGSGTLLASSNASDTDGGGNECVQTFW